MQFYQQIQEILANNVFQDYGVIGLFLNSFLSSTAIPLPTEILTSALLLGGESQILVGIALVLGSTIGGLLNYFIGFGGNTLITKFKKKKDGKDIEQKNNDNKLLKKFGWSAIFFAAWIPIIGDLILIAAGAKKMKFVKFIIFMITGKTFKTIAVVSGLGLVF
ncbi:MAG: YqaA family protein [Nitrosopumilus sp.]